MRRGLLWAPLAIFAAIAVFVAWSLVRPPDRTVYSRMVGQRLPAFALPPATPGKPGLASAALHGRPRVVNVFASWCVPCAAEAPQLQALRQRGVEVDGVAVRDTPTALRDFLARNGDPYAAIGDDREGRAQLALGSSGVPESFVVDGAGVIVSQHVGDIRAEEVADIAAAVKSAR